MKNENFMLKMKAIANNDFGTIDYVIYNAILDQNNKITELTLEEFAKMCFTSKPSILKFCNKVGLSGYSELKFLIKMNSELKQTTINEFTIVNKYKESDAFRQKYLLLSQKYTNSLLKNFNINQEKISSLVTKIFEAEAIYIFSANLAYYALKGFEQKMRWLHKNIILENDINVIESYASHVPAKSVCIIISLSGLNPHINEIVNWISPKQYVFLLASSEEKLFRTSENNFDIPQDENELWDNYSLRAQYLTSFFDLLFIELNKKYFSS